MTTREEKFEKIHEDLINLVHWYANTYATEHVMMDRDEVVGELLLEMAKAFDTYGDRDTEEIKRLIQQMMKNRISELKYRHFLTHRGAGNAAMSLDDFDDDSVMTAEYIGYTQNMEGFVFLEELRARLSDTALEVLNLVLNWNQRLCDVFDLSMMRAGAIYKNHKAVLKPHHIAEALMVDVSDVKKAWKEITLALQEI